MSGPITFLVHEEIIALFIENTFNLVKAIPKDIKIKKIVANISHSVVLITNVGKVISLYNISAENKIA